jgi:hypothetical protein
MTEARGGGSRRRRVTFRELIQLANFMTDRDREIALFLYRHQVLTTEQVELLFFPSRRAAQKRLLKLLEHVVVERFYPPIPYGRGKQQAHWVLGAAGVKLVAACLEVEPKFLGLQRRDDWGAHPQLVHRLEVNTFVTELVRATLQDPEMGVTGWRGQTGAGRRLELPNGRRIVAPDAGFDLVCASSVIECYLEWDRGTETAWRVAEKVRRFGRLFQKMHYLDRWPINLLFVVPSEGRLRAVQDEVQKRVSDEPHRFAELFMEWPTVITTAPELRRNGPLAPIWRNVSDGAEPRALPELMPKSLEPARLDWTLGRCWRDSLFSLEGGPPLWDYIEGRPLHLPRPLEDPYDWPAGRREAA